MKLFAILRALAPLLVLGCSLLGSSHAHLAAYSETRSFRDALEGRSMEEAISGPVDKDTSSYGERTADSSAASGSSTPTSSTIMSIPANGNLQQQQQQQQMLVPPVDKQQQQKSGAGEIEREAGPIGPNYPTDGQQMMEQTVRAKQMRVGGSRNGRLMKMMAGSMNARTARLQQQADKTNGSQGPEQAYGNDAQRQDTQMPAAAAASVTKGFGDEQMNGVGKQQESKIAADKYPTSGTSSAADNGRLQQEQEQPDDSQAGYGQGQQQQQMRSTNAMDSADALSQMMAPATGDQQMNYDTGDDQLQQQQISAKQMQPNGNGRSQKYGASNASMGGQKKQYGAESMGMKLAQATGMAQSMMMSLANKAAYAAGQREQVSQRQLAPPMMQAAGQQSYNNNGASTSGFGAYGATDKQQQQQQGQMQMSLMNGSGQMSANYQQMTPAARMMVDGASSMAGSMRPMRRASQRKADKKMSPAMMNAMLNRMLAGRLQEENGASSDAQYGGVSRSPASSMLTASNMMKTSMGAEMLANMMVMNANGAAQMSSAKKNQYKQMLMRAMLQQQQQLNDEEGAAGYEQANEPVNEANKYGQRATPAPATMMMMPLNGNANGNGMSSYTKPPAASSGSNGQSVAAMGMGLSMGPAMNPYGQMSSGSANGMEAMQKMQKMQAAYSKQQEQQQPMQDDVQQQLQQKMSSMGGQQRAMGAGEAEYGAGKGAGSTTMRPAMFMIGANGQSAMNGQMVRMAGMDANRNYVDRKGNPANQLQMAGQNKMYGGQQQERQKMDAPSMMGTAYGAQQMGADKMNGFRPAYSGASAQQRQTMMGQDEAREQYGQAQQAEMADSGTKAADAGQATKSAAPSRQMQMSYGSNESASENGNQEQQQQQREEEEQQQQQKQEADGYGAAPMGQAEPFAFNYKTQDNYGNEQYRKEESDKNGVVRGYYGYMDQSGIFRHVEYVADENGFRANVKSNEPGLSNERTPGSSSSKPSPAQTNSAASGDSPMSAMSPMLPMSPAMNEGAGNGVSPMAPMAPPSSSSSLGGSSGTGDASLRLQQQLQEQQQQVSQLPMAPLMEMAAGMAQQASQQPEREMQQQQKQYGGISDNGSGIEK